MKSRKPWLAVGVSLVLLLAGAGLMVARPWEGSPTGVSLASGLYNWAQNGTATFNTDVNGKTYMLSDTFMVKQNMRFGTTALPAGWHVTRDSGSGAEAARYDIANDDKKATVKTNNMANNTGKLFDTQLVCSEYVAKRASSSNFLEQYKIAALGTVKTGQASKYVVAVDNGDGVEMYTVKFSYIDMTGVMHYSVVLYRCGGANSLQITVDGTVSEEATNETVTNVVKHIVLKGAA